MLCKTEKESAELIRRLAEYELASCCVWFLIAGVQICTCYLAIAGIWNIFVAVSRYQMIDRIKARDARIPEEHESATMLIVVGLVNLLLGGVVGVAMVAFDFYVRNQILENRHVFNMRLDGIPQMSSVAGTTPSQDNAVELLTRLARLRELGALSLDEFSKMKQSLLEQFRNAK